MVLQFKTIKYQCKTVYNIINTLVLKNRFRTLTFFFLLNFEHDSTIFPPFLLAYTFNVLDLISQHNQPNTICYLLCAIYYARFTMHYALCTMHYVLYIMHYALFTMYYALCTMHYSLCTMHYVLCIISLCTMHYALCINTYSYVFTILYVFIRIYYFTWKSGEIP